MNEQRRSLISWPESEETTLLARFQAGNHANNTVPSGWNPLEQRCSLTSRPEFAPTALFADTDWSDSVFYLCT
jgi:hypothetical protein